MTPEELSGTIEALLFASGEPLSLRELKKILARLWDERPEAERDADLAAVGDVVAALQSRWPMEGSTLGFGLLKIADGYAFRSNPRYGDALLAMREQRPVRLSKAGLETLAIIAYRQPVTKPETDDIRGVDCGGTIRMLLDRGLVRILGKKEEPGRPLLYGTSKEFLSFFNLGGLNQLPTLREFTELSEDAADELRGFDGLTDLRDLKEAAQSMRLDAEPSLDALDQAVDNLKNTEKRARTALAEEGIVIAEEASVAAEGGAPAEPIAGAEPAPVTEGGDDPNPG